MKAKYYAITLAVLGGAIATTFILPKGITVDTVRSEETTSRIQIYGTVRDFRLDHPDFDVSPSAGWGHYAGNVGDRLGNDGKPVFVPPSSYVTEFHIDGQRLVADAPFAVQLKVLGSAIFNGSYHRPITMQAYVGSDVYEPFGGYTNPTTANLNDDQSGTGWQNSGANPRYAVLGDLHPANTQVKVMARSWSRTSGDGTDDSHWSLHREGDSTVSTPQLIVLRDGDPVPSQSGLAGQTSAAEYVEAYVDFEHNTMNLGPNQVIYLFELGTTGTSSSADFQDLVVLVSLATDPGYFYADGRADVEGEMPGGFKVDLPWQDDTGNPIAPHTFADATGNGSLAGFKGVATQESIRIEDGDVVKHGGNDFTMTSNDSTEVGVVSVLAGGFVDGDIRVGPDGDPAMDIFIDPAGSIDGVTGTLAKPVAFPEMTVPNLGTSTGPLVLTSNTSVSEDLHLDSLTLADGVELTISGKQAFVIDGGLTLGTGAKINVSSLASALDVYMSGPLTLGDGAEINTTLNKPKKVSIFYLGTQDIHLNSGRKVVAGVYAPNARLELTGGEMWGNTLAKGLTVSNGGKFTVRNKFGVRSFPMVNTCGDTLTDEAGDPGSASSGAITSGDTFAQWFTHDLAVNTSMVHPILLTNNGSGVWEYLDDEFYPGDDQLFGNEGQSHNNFFTYSIEASFTYEACTGQFFEFEGADDAWVYVDNQLAIDLGGMQQATRQRVDIDRLGLEDGTVHTLRLFFAQRQPYMSRFNIRTNLLLEQPGQIVSVSGGYD